jgi:RecA/RadA recombinase
MPTVSAAKALQDLKTSYTRCISTGLVQLDAVLQNREPILSEGEPVNGGVTRGKVTEVYGPPGVGKTALGWVQLED